MGNARRVGLMMLTIVLLSSAALAQSQATTGVIEGTVSDPSRAAPSAEAGRRQASAVAAEVRAAWNSGPSCG